MIYMWFKIYIPDFLIEKMTSCWQTYPWLSSLPECVSQPQQIEIRLSAHPSFMNYKCTFPEPNFFHIFAALGHKTRILKKIFFSKSSLSFVVFVGTRGYYCNIHVCAIPCSVRGHLGSLRVLVSKWYVTRKLEKWNGMRLGTREH